MIKTVHKIIEKYNSYIITAIVILIFQISSIIHNYIFHKDLVLDISADISELLSFFLAITLFFIIYLIFDTIFKKMKFKIFINIILAAITSAFIKINLVIFTKNHINEIRTIFSEMFLEALFEICYYLIIVFVVQYIIKNFMFINTHIKPAGFILQIPEHHRKNIYLIKARENYIEVYYGKKRKYKLINYRFSNAIQEIPSSLGLQIHRSYWVSLDSLKTLKRFNNKYYIKSKNNETIPVSQTYIKDVREKII